MSIKVVKINGEHPKLDYQKLEDSFEAQFHSYCHEASIFVLNQFPVLVTPETDIDFILIVVVEDSDRNYIYFTKDDRKIYLHNLIIPVKYVTDFVDSEITQDGNYLFADDADLDYSKEVVSLIFDLKDYLQRRCRFDEVYIHPLVFVENDLMAMSDDIVVAGSFDFYILADWLRTNNKEVLISYNPWRDYYEGVTGDLERVIEQAGRDSETGYLTRAKIERIGRELSTKDRLVDELGRKLIMIKGKAGSGKTTELLTLCIKALTTTYNPYFLTYNKVLVYDLSHILKVAMNARRVNNYATVNTLHGFFYDLSLKLSVLHVMSDERIAEILDTLKIRIKEVFEFIRREIDYADRSSYTKVKEKLQNSELDKGTTEVGIDLINHLVRNLVLSEEAFKIETRVFYERQRKKLASIGASEVFLADYYGVLKSTLLAMQDPDEFYLQFNMQYKAELIDLATGKGDLYTDENGEISQSSFSSFTKRRVGSRKGKKRIVLIDEAQDCHRLEKEILATLYGSDRLVVANGGKEQLIRHVDLCNWEMIAGRPTHPIIKNKKNKSFRIKPVIGSFCNFYSARHGINLDLESLETIDHGELIFDFRDSIDYDEMVFLFDNLMKKGEVHGCKPYESMLVLLESLDGGGESIAEQVQINEYGNILTSIEYSRGKWEWLSALENEDYQFYDATAANKSELGLPYPNEIRVIYYESCRGLESWSVACFDLDLFFDEKKEEEEAEKFLIEDEKEGNVQDMFISNEQRKRMYAATWVLMALTRAIDTLYIKVNSLESEFGQAVEEYLKSNPENVKVIR